jgi:hypothetical protein
LRSSPFIAAVTAARCSARDDGTRVLTDGFQLGEKMVAGETLCT